MFGGIFLGLPEVSSNKLPDVWAVRRWDVRRVDRLLLVERVSVKKNSDVWWNLSRSARGFVKQIT